VSEPYRFKSPRGQTSLCIVGPDLPDENALNHPFQWHHDEHMAAQTVLGALNAAYAELAETKRQLQEARAEVTMRLPLLSVAEGERDVWKEVAKKAKAEVEREQIRNLNNVGIADLQIKEVRTEVERAVKALRALAAAPHLLAQRPSPLGFIASQLAALVL